MERLVIGIDISKASFTAAVWDGAKAIDLGEMTNDAAGYRTLHTKMNEWQQRLGRQQTHLILEVTGGYELGVVAYAYTQDWAVRLPRPKGTRKQVRDWAKGEGKRAKNDRLDAQMLTLFGVKKQPKPQQPLPAEVRELDNLLARRQDLEQMLRQERNRQGDLRGRPDVPASVMNNLQQVIEALEQALAEIEQPIQQLLQTYSYLQEAMERLLALPGIGKKNVLPRLVLLERWHTLTNGQGSAKGTQGVPAALAGLDPQVYESGSSLRKHRAISRMGDKEVCRLLYMGVLGGVRGDNPLRTFYQPLVGRGKAKKLALVAASRKLLTWAWAVFSTDADWNPTLYAAVQP
jgi:transposase